MKLTPKLKQVILTQFKTGDTIPYLAALYQVPQDKIEHVIRLKLLDDEESLRRAAEKFVDNVFDGRRQDLP